MNEGCNAVVKTNPVEKVTRSNQSVEKVLMVIEALSRQQEPVRLQDFAQMVGMNISTVSRFLTTLQRNGYVAQAAESGRYYLTLKLCAIAGRVSAGFKIKDITTPYLRSLSQIFSESVNLSVDQSMEVLYIDVVSGTYQMLTTLQRIGNVAPMHCTGSGKLLLLNYDAYQIERYVAVKGLTVLTPKSISTKEQLVEELAKVRARDYAIDDEECTVGVRCVALPIRDYTGKIVAGISVSGPAMRMTDEYIFGKISYIADATKDISKRLGYEGG